MNYPVNEIFYSIQGEGYFTGKPMVFVRFSGCNINCDFCDTDHSGSIEMDESQILEKVKEYPAKTVLLTGGEPTIHNLQPLTMLLQKMGYRVHIETNGTNPVDYNYVNWVTCSPKFIDGKMHLHHTMFMRAEEVKVVYTGQQDLDQIREQFETNIFYLQPCSCNNIPETLEFVLKHPEWRLSLQTHKLINIK